MILRSTLDSKGKSTALNYQCLLFRGRRNRIVTLKNNLKTSAVEYFIINGQHYCVNFTKMNQLQNNMRETPTKNLKRITANSPPDASRLLTKNNDFGSSIVDVAHFYNIPQIYLRPFPRMKKQCYQGNLWQQGKPPTTPASFIDKIEKDILGIVCFCIQS